MGCVVSGWLVGGPAGWLCVPVVTLPACSVAALPNADYWKIGLYFGVLLLAWLLFSLPMSYLKHSMVDWVNTEELKWVLSRQPPGNWRCSRGCRARSCRR